MGILFERVLVLAPHTDDGEIGCGGTISRFVEEGCKVSYVAFSAAEKSVPREFPKDILEEEVQRATAALGIRMDDLITLGYQVRDFSTYRQDILDDMVRLEKDICPEMVLLPSPNDTHQDHEVIAHEAFRAFKKVTMLGYEIPWNNLTFNTSAFLFLQERHLSMKVEALKCYGSQQGKRYFNEDFVRSLARMRGTQIGADYAEAFEVIRWVMK